MSEEEIKQDEFLKYADKLSNESFLGWSDDEISGYKTALGILTERYKLLHYTAAKPEPVKPVEGEKDVKYITAYGLKTKVWCFKGEYGYGCAECCYGDCDCEGEERCRLRGRRNNCPHCKGKGWIPKQDAEEFIEPVKPSLQSVEEAAKEYALKVWEGQKPNGYIAESIIDFKAGAEWQAQVKQPVIEFVNASKRTPDDFKPDELIIGKIISPSGIKIPVTGTYDKSDRTFYFEGFAPRGESEFNNIEWLEEPPIQ